MDGLSFEMNRDAALYALGVGVCAKDALDDKELKYVYHPDGQQSIHVFFYTSKIKLDFDFFRS